MSLNKHLVTIPAHNSYRDAWRASVAAYSCMRRQRVYPLILVHGAGALEPEFVAAAAEGVLVARVPSCNKASVLAHAGRAAQDLGAEFVVRIPVDTVWNGKASFATQLAIGGGVIVVPAEDVEGIAEAWHLCSGLLAGLRSLGLDPARRKLVADNQSPGSVSRRPLLRYTHDHPCWNPSLFTDRADEEVVWEPLPIRSDTIQGRIHREVLGARRFWSKEAVTA